MLSKEMSQDEVCLQENTEKWSSVKAMKNWCNFSKGFYNLWKWSSTKLILLTLLRIMNHLNS